MWLEITSLVAAGIIAGVLLTFAVRRFQEHYRAPPPPDYADVDQSELDRKKLGLEVRSLEAEPQRARTQTWLSILTAMLTATTTLTVAIGGWAISSQLQANANRQHDAENYLHLLQAVDDKSSAVRIGAVVALQKYALRAQDGPSDDTSKQTAFILVNRLGTEDDPVTIHALTDVLRSLGPSVVQPILDTYRQNHLELVLSERAYGAALARTSCSHLPRGEADWRISTTIEQTLQTAFRSLSPLDTRRVDPGFQRFGGQEWLLQLERGPWCSPRREAVPVQAPSDALTLERRARAEIAMARLLGTLVGVYAAQLRGTSLVGIALLDVDWSAGRGRTVTDLTDFDLRYTWIVGNLDGAIFDRADLSNANLFFTTVGSASFRSSALSGTAFHPKALSRTDIDFSQAEVWGQPKLDRKHCTEMYKRWEVGYGAAPQNLVPFCRSANP